LHYSADWLTRQQVEARLLTGQSYDEIGSKLPATPKAVEYYEQLFFNVRDRLACKDWISNIIEQRRRDEREWGCTSEEAERGYVMRKFAYSGGPLVLDALLNPIQTANPQPRNVEEWFQECAASGIAVAAASAVTATEFTHAETLQLMKLALKNASRVRTEEEIKKDNEYCQRLIDGWDEIQRALGGTPKTGEPSQ
jgi:hypothetical protein